jgi:hypothetical protein
LAQIDVGAVLLEEALILATKARIEMKIGGMPGGARTTLGDWARARGPSGTVSAATSSAATTMTLRTMVHSPLQSLG